MAFLVRINLLVGILICTIILTFNPLFMSVVKRTFSSNASSLLGPDNKTPLVGYIMQMITGLLLSDATLVKKYANGGTYLQLAQSVIHGPFIVFVHNLMYTAGLCNMTAPSTSTAVANGYKYLYLSFATRSFVSWNVLHSAWYQEGIKVLPHNISDLLTPISLAYWLMGDGGWNGNGINLATNNFSRTEIELLVSILASNFGLHCSIQSRNRLYIWARSVPKFVEIVRPHMEESMMYKIDKSCPKPIKQTPIKVS